jgi:2-succinyl-5-enolpyruvyl-6-hydroxy-3-cyclohexene-1-carboxylate synthase
MRDVNVDGHTILVEAMNRTVKASFADVAPGADKIGSHFDPHCCHDRGMQSADVTATFCATLVDEWCRLGVRLAIVAPGSRSTPMALAIAAEPKLAVQVFHDERSAAFAALGAAKASGVPTLLLCTSGTAAVNFHPAVVEASYAEVPLIVLTADRPPELQGVGAPQTIDQRQLYGSTSRAFLDTGVAEDSESTGWRQIAQRAFVATTANRPGPVHVNLPFREPLVGVAGELPPPIPLRTSSNKPRVVGTETLAKLAMRLSGKRGVIVAGAGCTERDALLALATALRWPIIADPLSNVRLESRQVVRHADAWLRDPLLAKAFRPQSVLRLGALPASKVVNTWLRESQPEVTSVTSTSTLIDPDRITSLHITADIAQLCRDLSQLVSPGESEWHTRWCEAEEAARQTLSQLLDDESQLSEPGVARAVVAHLPHDAHLMVSSSMPIRDVEWYSGSCEHLRVLANRGVNGIDGVVSSAVGVALATGFTTGLLIGDVAFLHDVNGLLGLKDREVDLRIVVVDNRGGGIFSFLPQRATLGNERFEQLFGTPHDVDLPAICRAHGIAVAEASTTAQLHSALGEKGPFVIVVRTNRDENVTKHDALHRAIIDAVTKAA